MSIYDMTSDEYKKILDQFIVDNPGVIKDYFSIAGHMDLTHRGWTDEEMKSRCIDEHKDVSEFLEYSPADGEFEDRNDIIENALLYSSREIAEWAVSSDRKDKELTIPFDNIIGYGYQNRTLEKMDTPVLHMVLRKDKSDPYFGFRVETAYPYLKDERAQYLRQYECSRINADPYKDGKLAISPDRLDDYRKPVMTKDEARAQIKDEIIDVLRDKRDRDLEHEKELVKDFCRANGIPYKKTETRTEVGERSGKKERCVEYDGKIIGYIKKDRVAEKYRAMEEVKDALRAERQKRADRKKDDIGR